MVLKIFRRVLESFASSMYTSYDICLLEEERVFAAAVELSQLLATAAILFPERQGLAQLRGLRFWIIILGASFDVATPREARHAGALASLAYFRAHSSSMCVYIFACVCVFVSLKVLGKCARRVGERRPADKSLFSWHFS